MPILMDFQKLLISHQMAQNIPTAYNTVFTDGIQHPELFLWDAWSYYDQDGIHLYCLAVSRVKEDGTRLNPAERNSFPFHIRHFSSQDEGGIWKDEGCFLTPGTAAGSHDAKTLWSGSIEPLTDGRKLVAYTGLSDVDKEHCFLQNIALAISNDGYKIDKVADEALSSPQRDWAEITGLGYYLDHPDNIGHNDGENGGPIMAWRDPFVFLDTENKIHLFWAAKIDAHKNAMAHALLEKDGDLFRIARLFPPTTLVDGAEYTQLELPKILYDQSKNLYYLIISTCNRLFEGQSDDEVDKKVRLYRSSSLEGPWEPWGKKGSVILQSENLFGMTVLKPDFKNDRLLCIAPYTDAAPDELSLTFSRVFYVDLDPVDVIFP